MRRTLFLTLTFFLLALMGTAVPQAQAPAAGPYHFLKEIHIGGAGSWDYGTIDETGRRLYMTHGTEVVVIDIDKDEVVGKIADTPGVHGFTVAPELGLGFSSNGRENKAGIVDLKTLETKSKVDTGGNPDSILYVPGVQEVYTFNGRTNDATVFEAKTGKVVATIPLSGKPEFAVADIKAGRIYNNIEDKNEVAVIDIKTHKVVATWPIAPGEGASGMAIDLQTHRLFIGAGGANLMVMMDSTSGKVVATVPIGAGVDANKFDPATKLAFSSNGGAGNVTIAKEESPDKLTVVQTLATARGSRTMALDPKTHKIYLAAVEYQPAPANPPAGNPPAKGGRAPAVPDSYKVLVYGTDLK
jgi:DNA-binding beta-propeller fold protein YncE